MGHLWIPDIPVWEKILRSVVIYLFILIAFRFTGKRQVGQLTPFDLVLHLVLTNNRATRSISPSWKITAKSACGAAVRWGAKRLATMLSLRACAPDAA